jgi:hypothetical protein
MTNPSSIYDTRNCTCDLCKSARRRRLSREVIEVLLFLFVIGILAAVCLWNFP